jgi:uncharacterized protein (TIGR03083 family)
VSPPAWTRPTNCPPWLVRDLAVHAVISGKTFVSSVSQGLAGSVEPAGAEERRRRQSELEEAEPSAVADALRAVEAEFAGLYAGLGERELSALCFHRRGNRSVRWYAVHRLAEVAFHSWDLDWSLGREPVLAEGVAALLLPTLLESNAPRTYAAALSAGRGNGERYLLVAEGDAPARWLVQIDPEQLLVTRADSLVEQRERPADLTVTGTAADLALLVYGRRTLDWLSRSGAVDIDMDVDGDPELIRRFEEIFPRP